MISHFNVNFTAAKKIVYSTNEVGVTTMAENEATEKVVHEKAPVVATTATKVDLKAIDDKLNEILDNNIIPGV